MAADDTVEYSETNVPEGDARGDVLEVLARGNPWLFIHAHDIDDAGFGIKLEVGGGVREVSTIRALLQKTLNALPEG